jgi:hypothetical protein
MALSLSCSCGARFEVEETFAGQTVSCPECQQPVQAPAILRRALRTSGFAVASVVLALVLAFTGIGTVAAVVLGMIALVHISRHRDQVTGMGYALFGIVFGVIFTVLFFMAILHPEVFGTSLAREGLMGSQVDRAGPMEVAKPEDGFAMRRPSNRWGVANRQLAQELVPGSELVLVNIARDAYIDVTLEQLEGRTLETYRDQVLDNFKEQPDPLGKRKPLQLHSLTIRDSQKLPAAKDRESFEVLLDVRMGPQPLTFLLRIIRPKGSNQVYVVRGWAQKRRFTSVETEVRQAMDSFRLLNP